MANDHIRQLDNVDIAALTRAEAAELLAQVKALEGRLLARLLTGDTGASAQAHESNNAPDRLLTIAQAAEVLGVSTSFLYHRHAKLGIARKLGDGTLRFSHAAIQKVIKQGALKLRACAQRVNSHLE